MQRTDAPIRLSATRTARLPKDFATVMDINGKQATALKLHCPNQCGGFIENEVLLYLLEGDELYIYGKCSECGQAGNMTVSLIELASKCPTLAIQ